MTSCVSEDSPGYGNEASGAIERLQRRVQMCGPRNNKNAITGLGSGCCIKPVPVGLAAVQQSAYLMAKMNECPAFRGPPPPKNGTDYVLQKQFATIECENPLRDPAQRFAKYYKFTPDLCPPVPTEQLNSTLPKPSFEVCQPSRFN